MDLVREDKRFLAMLAEAGAARAPESSGPPEG